MKVNLNIDSYGTDNDYLGLFGKLEPEANVSNLGLEEYEINVPSNNSNNYESRYIGGLIGFNEGNIINCFSNGNIYAENKSESIGGLVGYNHGGLVSGCYTAGKVSGGYDSSSRYIGVGGFVGMNYESDISDCLIKNCYSTCTVTNGYGFSGSQHIDIYYEGCFWDIESSGKTLGYPYYFYEVEGGLDTAQMQQKSTYITAGWDFDNEWWISEGVDYPKLFWQLRRKS